MSEKTYLTISEDDESKSAHDEPYKLSLTVTSYALSNGQATNSATAYLSRHGVPQSHKRIDFEVTGSALFTNGARSYSLQTDAYGKVTVFFTDEQSESVVVICSFRNSTAFSNSYFNANLLEISVAEWVDRASGNGVAANQLFYHVYDSVTNQSIGNALIQFKVLSGEAQLSAMTGTTTQDGNFLLSITRSSPGVATIGAELPGHPTANNYIYIIFTEFMSGYRLTAHVFPRTADGQIYVTYTLVEVSTGRGVPGRMLDMLCGAEQTFNRRLGPTDQDGKVSEWWWNAPNAINHMLAVLVGDNRANAPFTLDFKTPLI